MSTTFTSADVAYIRDGFLTLEEVCADRPEIAEHVRALIAAGVLPRPSYVLDDGTEMFPDDYFRLVDEAGGPGRLREAFDERFLAAGGPPDELERIRSAYLDGIFGICLREVTPETIARKIELVASLRGLLTAPRPDEPEWRETLRAQVEELDALEKEMAPHFDRRDHLQRPPTRDFLIRAARGLYEDVFYPAG
jgi:hypothetical protein